MLLRTPEKMVSKQKMMKYVNGYGFFSFTINLTNKYEKQLLDTATKARPQKRMLKKLLPKN